MLCFPLLFNSSFVNPSVGSLGQPLPAGNLTLDMLLLGLRVFTITSKILFSLFPFFCSLSVGLYFDDHIVVFL